MSTETRTAARTVEFFSPRTRLILLATMFMGALAVRLHRVTEPPLNFHPTRQYRSAILARAYYYKQSDALPEWKQRLVDRWQNVHGLLEPPIMEYAASIAYRITGKERLWIPRVTCAVLWMVGAVFIYRLAGRLASRDGAVLSVAFYLFVPFGVSASRSFQPDPIMVSLLIVAIYGFVRYFEDGSKGWFDVTLAACALSPLLKPTCAFMLVTTLAMLSLRRFGVVRVLRRWDVWMLLCTVALPMLAYYLAGPGARMAEKIQVFVPELWATDFYWRGWLNKVWYVVGYPALIGGLAGAALFRPGAPRSAAAGLWSGYVLFGLTFAYHAHTHDYYHLMLIPVVALCLAPIAEAVVFYVAQSPTSVLTRAALIVVLVAGLLASMDRAPWRQKKGSGGEFVAMAERIGDLIRHSDKTVYLSRGYGKPLQYHGELAGVSWPSTGERRAQLRRGGRQLEAPVRLDEIIRRLDPDFFVVTSLKDFRHQPDLESALYGNYTLLVDSERFKIFDMR